MQMRVDEVTWQILLARSKDAVQVNTPGFKMRVDDVAGNVRLSPPGI
jgi:hypothetical protein